MSRPVILVVLIGIIVSILGGAIGNAFGLGFLGSPIAHIQLPAEPVFPKPFIDTGSGLIGNITITNTMVASWITIVILAAVTFTVNRKIREVPGRIQGLAEVTFEFLLGLARNIAGDNARRFFPLAMTIFLFILVNNWIGILPGFGTIGWVESPEKVVHHAEVKAEKDHGHVNLDTVHLQVFEGTGPIVLLPPGSIDNHMKVSQGYYLTDDGGLKDVPEGQYLDDHGHLKDIPEGQYLDDHGHLKDIPEGENKENWYGYERKVSKETPNLLIKSQTPGLLIPYLRSANSDLNTPLALALVAMVMIHWWAFSTLGVFGHLGKFINFKQGPIMFVVGILEIIGELARIVSFTFRLFGNIFAGEMLLIVMAFLLPVIGIIPFLGMELFVGFMQATVFAVLTLLFGSMAVASHDEH